MGENDKESQSVLRKTKEAVIKTIGCDPATTPKATGAITTCQLHSTFCAKTDTTQLSQDQERSVGTSKTTQIFTPSCTAERRYCKTVKQSKRSQQGKKAKEKEGKSPTLLVGGYKRRGRKQQGKTQTSPAAILPLNNGDGGKGKRKFLSQKASDAAET